MPSPRPRRFVMRRHGAAITAAGVLTLVLSGCVGAPANTPSPSPSVSAEPVFASDEEALAAAEAAYRSFEEVSALIASESGNDAERIEAVATPTYTVQLLDEFAQYRALGIRAEGQTALDSFSLVQQQTTAAGSEVVIYVCRDVGDVRVRDASGADVTPLDRASRTPLIATLVAGDGARFLVDGVELWSGEDFC
ncbi:hypothetical protein [Agromyces bauzanensis]|nr:hypothetical protein [Agromyces bauzanensis]